MPKASSRASTLKLKLMARMWCLSMSLSGQRVENFLSPIMRISRVVLVFSTKGEFLRSWGGEGEDDGQFRYPATIDIDAAGNVYVVDVLNARVQKFDAAGTHLLTIGELGGKAGTFFRPKGIAVDGTAVFTLATASSAWSRSSMRPVSFSTSLVKKVQRPCSKHLSAWQRRHTPVRDANAGGQRGCPRTAGTTAA